MLPIVFGVCWSDGICQLRDRTSNCGDSGNAKYNNYRSFGLCRYVRGGVWYIPWGDNISHIHTRRLLVLDFVCTRYVSWGVNISCKLYSCVSMVVIGETKMMLLGVRIGTEHRHVYLMLGLHPWTPLSRTAGPENWISLTLNHHHLNVYLTTGRSHQVNQHQKW